MQWTRTILDGLMMTGYFCFAAGAGVLARPMMACNMYSKEIRKLAKRRSRDIKSGCSSG